MDIHIHKVKTKTMIVERQEKIEPATVESEYKHECEFCGSGGDMKHIEARGVKIHRAACV